MRIITPNRLMAIPVISTLLIVGVACKPEEGQRSKTAIWTYEMSGQYASGTKKKIGARYTYGSRAASVSSNSGMVTVSPKTAGPKKASINVTAPGGGKVNCKLVVKKGGTKIVSITNSGSGAHGATCTFQP